MNCKARSVSDQRGAVLIFSLIMLLLLTLASVSMIQQNKQELAMTGNTVEQTITLARAETDLSLTEQAIATLRLNPAAAPGESKCNTGPDSLVNEGWVFPDEPVTGQAEVRAVYCLRDKREYQCTFTDGVRDDIGACKCFQIGAEGSEIYAIRWTSTAGGNYGAQRTVESKYAVDCTAVPP